MCVHVTKRACDVCMDTDRHADNVAAVLLVRVRKNSAWWEGNNAVCNLYTLSINCCKVQNATSEPSGIQEDVHRQ